MLTPVAPQTVPEFESAKWRKIGDALEVTFNTIFTIELVVRLGIADVRPRHHRARARCASLAP